MESSVLTRYIILLNVSTLPPLPLLHLTSIIQIQVLFSICSFAPTPLDTFPLSTSDKLQQIPTVTSHIIMGSKSNRAPAASKVVAAKPSPKPVTKFVRTFTERADLSKKDVIITADTIIHNIVEFDELSTLSTRNGTSTATSTLILTASSKDVLRVATNKYSAGHYKFTDDLQAMGSKQKSFWSRNSVEIVVDFGTFPAGIENLSKEEKEKIVAASPLIDKMKSLGPMFAKCT